jgi:hypothetical protein
VVRTVEFSTLSYYLMVGELAKHEKKGIFIVILRNETTK